MSETANKRKATTRSKTRTAKSTVGSNKEPVEQSAETKPTQAEQDALKVEAENTTEVDAKAETEVSTQAEESSSEKPQEVAESDEQEPSAETADSKQDEKGSDEDVNLDSTKTTDGDAGDHDLVLGILGALKVRAKSDQGFWRSGVQFFRTKETVLLVVDEEPKDQPEIVAQEGIEPELILFMSKEKAKRVHLEPNLIVEDVDVSDVVDIQDAK